MNWMAFLRLLAEQHAPRVGQDVQCVSVQLDPAGHRRRTVQRFEFVEVGAINDDRLSP